MDANTNRADPIGDAMEAAARLEIELRVGRSLTEAEWTAARGRLLEFANILRDWGRDDDSCATR